MHDDHDSQPSFEAPLFFDQNPTEDMLALLGVGILALRRIGSGRNRGRGHVKCTLHNGNEDITKKHIEHFGEA